MKKLISLSFFMFLWGCAPSETDVSDALRHSETPIEAVQVDKAIERTPVDQANIKVTSDFPYTFTAPESWRKEVVTFPLSFAPELDYEGHGDVRFAPGMFTTGAEDFWTYSFVWWLPLDTEITPDRLSVDMNAYFSGLANLIMKSREQEVPDHKAFAHFQMSDNPHASGSRNMALEGRVETLDAFATQKPVALNAKVELIPCLAQDRIALIFGFSPQPFSHENWNTLNQIKAGFQCSPD